MAAEIKRVVIQIGDREIELSTADAKALKAALDELFGKETIKEVVRDHWWWQPTYVPYAVPYVGPSYPIYGGPSSISGVGACGSFSFGNSATFMGDTLTLNI